MNLKATKHEKNESSIRLGFVVDFEAAALIIAAKAGYFTKAGLNVTLFPFVGWATLREAFISGTIDIAHMPSAMAIELNDGLSDQQLDCEVGMLTSLGTLDTFFCNEIFDTDQNKRIVIKNDHAGRKYRIGVPTQFSSENVLVEHLIKNNYIDGNLEFEISYIPSSQLLYNFLEGFIDAFCAGEGWASLAKKESCVLTYSCDLELPELALTARKSFATDQYEDWKAVVSVAESTQRKIYQDSFLQEAATLLSAHPAMPYTGEQLQDIFEGQIAKRSKQEMEFSPSLEGETALRTAMSNAKLFEKSSRLTMRETFNPTVFTEATQLSN